MEARIRGLPAESGSAILDRINKIYRIQEHKGGGHRNCMLPISATRRIRG
jgi:hypothetical protein